MKSFKVFDKSIPKRPRGRPPIKPNSTPYYDSCSYESTPVGNRSHSQILKNASFVVHNQTIETDDSQTDFESFNVCNNVPFNVKTEFPVVKRPRGRPRKQKTIISGISNVLIESKLGHITGSMVKKRPRGRPLGSKKQIQMEFDDSSQDINAYVEVLPATRLRARSVCQRNWIESDSESDTNDHIGLSSGKRKSKNSSDELFKVNRSYSFVQKGRGRPLGSKKKRCSLSDVPAVQVKVEHKYLKKPRGRPLGSKNKKKIVKLRPIKIEVEDPVEEQPRDRPIVLKNTNINKLCKPFEIKLENIYTSNQFKNWLKPTNL